MYEWNIFKYWANQVGNAKYKYHLEFQKLLDHVDTNSEYCIMYFGWSSRGVYYVLITLTFLFKIICAALHLYVFFYTIDSFRLSSNHVLSMLKMAELILRIIMIPRSISRGSRNLLEQWN